MIKDAIRKKFAWPGGYALLGISSDGAILCTDCMRKNFRQILWSVKNNCSDGWKVEVITHSDAMELDDWERCGGCNVELKKI